MKIGGLYCFQIITLLLVVSHLFTDSLRIYLSI